MPKPRKDREQPPARYDHRVEAWIRATHHAIRGVDLLMTAMLLQQTHRWRKQRKRVRMALEAFKNATNWTIISQNVPTRPMESEPKTGDKE